MHVIAQVGVKFVINGMDTVIRMVELLGVKLGAFSPLNRIDVCIYMYSLPIFTPM